jgi:flagellar biogenesis protein FliO
MIMKFALGLVGILVYGLVGAGVKVTSVDLQTHGSQGHVLISLDGRSNSLPDLKVLGREIEITIAGAEGFDAISKNVRGALLTANSLHGKAVVKATLPYNVDATKVDVGWRNNQINVIFPRGIAFNNSKIKERPTEDPRVSSNFFKENLNEDYLNKLMEDESLAISEKSRVPETKNDVVSLKQAANNQQNTAPPSVAIKNDSTKRSAESFSLAGHAAKFTGFLVVVLALFYGVVQLLKKGVFTKGKLGFLNNSNIVEVLSTTYVAPKRSLMIVRAHKQIFLLSNSESGISLVSEMKDTSGLLKEGEQIVTGTNFDVNLGLAQSDSDSDVSIKIKENILESTPATDNESGIKGSMAKDIVKFSDELKKKAKKLKPIEFN